MGISGKFYSTLFTSIFASTALLSCQQLETVTDIESNISHQPISALTKVGSEFTDTLVAGGLVRPTLMDFAPDGRLFVSEKAGALRIIKNGVLLPAPFTTVNCNTSGERGLLGVAFDPDFATNRFIYVNYVTSSGPNIRISRFTASLVNPDSAEAGSEFILLDLPPPPLNTFNHNGGSIHFGKDGKLYIGVGDAGDGLNSQSLNNPFGKILRINQDGSIPTDNPFYDSTTGINRAIVAMGLRNPFAFAVQRGTGRIFVNDVGDNTQEEIDNLLPGANYGWPTSEGNQNTAGFTAPIFAYGHDQGCSITGGDFYNPQSPTFPDEMIGDFFYTDYCGGWISRLDLETGTVTQIATEATRPVDIKVGGDGALYYLEYQTGAVRKITPKYLPVILEAEYAAHSGPIAANTETGYTGLGYLDFQNVSGDWVEFSGTLSTPTTVPLTLRYSNGTPIPCQVSVSLNGVVLLPTLSLPPTGSGSTWGQVQGSLALPSGLVHLRFATIGNGAPNLDHLRAF